MARTKGAIGRLNRDMKDVIHLAFQRAGGIDYLVRQAEAEPKAFMGLLGKIVPAEVRLDVAVALNLGQEMLKANETLARLQREADMKTIQHIDVTRDTVTLEEVKPLKTNDC